MKSIISIIIPIFSTSIECIHRLLETVCAFNKLSWIDIIIVDDGSNVKEKDYIFDIVQTNSNIIVLQQGHKGVGAARNNGIKHANNKYVYFLDADDEIPDTAVLEKMVILAEQKGANIVGGSMVEKHPDGSEYQGWTDVNKRFVFDKEGWIDYRNYQFDYGFYRFIYNTDFLRRNNLKFPHYSRFQDPPFFVRAMLKAKKFYAIPDNTYIYNVNSSVNWSKKKACDCVRGIIDNLKISRRKGLAVLHYVTILRFYRDFGNIIINNIEKSIKLKMLVSYAELLKDKYLLKEYNEPESMAETFCQKNFYQFNGR